MRTFSFVQGRGVVPNKIERELAKLVRGHVPSVPAREVLDDLIRRGFTGTDLARRARRRAAVLRACEPSIADELEQYALDLNLGVSR